MMLKILYKFITKKSSPKEKLSGGNKKEAKK